jgi:dTDP-glucose pyrophosphorylase
MAGLSTNHLPSSARFLDLLSVLQNTNANAIQIVDGKGKTLGFLDDFSARYAFFENIPPDMTLAHLLKQLKSSSSDRTKLNQLKHLFTKELDTTDQQELVNMPPMLIMAGGFGTRMQELTQHTPKPVLKIGDVPIIEHIINRSKLHGIDKFYISVHYLAEQIKNYLGDGSTIGVSIEYIHEKEPLGTGGCLSLLPKKSGSIIVCNGDIISKVNLRAMFDFHRSHQGQVTLGVTKFTLTHPFGVVEADGFRILKQVEKPSWTTWINAGLYIIDLDVRRVIKPKEYISMPQVMQRLIDGGSPVTQFPIFEEWSDIGSKNDYIQRNQ